MTTATDAREKLIEIVGNYYGALTHMAIVDIADRIIDAGFRLPEAAPSGNEAVEAARLVRAQPYGELAQNLERLAHIMANYILARAPRKDVMEAARAIAATNPSAIIALIESHDAEVGRLKRERDALFLFKQNMRLRNDPQYEAQAAIERALAAEAALAAAQKRVRNLEATIGWVANMTGPGNRAVINATELLNSIHDHARAALAEEIDNDKR